MKDAKRLKVILSDGIICSVLYEDGSEKFLLEDAIRDFGIWEQLNDGDVEYYFMKIFGDNCIILLSCSEFQNGFTIVWDYVQNKVIHLTKTPFAFCSIIWKNQVIDMYLVSFWGHPAELCYSIAPLDFIDSNYEPELIKLSISADNIDNNLNNCSISVEDDSIVFHNGEYKEVVTLNV